MSIPVNLAIEDELSELVLRRLLAHADREYSVGAAYRQGGFGYLRRTIKGWNAAAKGRPFLVLTDLDQEACPPLLIESWLKVPRHPNLLFRIAVREVEAWLLADPDNLARYLRISSALVPENPDAIRDPKSVLIGLARSSRSAEIRDRIAPRRGSTARQGPDFNACLGDYVRESWDVTAAASRSPSLARTVRRLNTFKPVWPRE